MKRFMLLLILSTTSAMAMLFDKPEDQYNEIKSMYLEIASCEEQRELRDIERLHPWEIYEKMRLIEDCKRHEKFAKGVHSCPALTKFLEAGRLRMEKVSLICLKLCFHYDRSEDKAPWHEKESEKSSS